MVEPAVRVTDLRRIFRVPEREAGLRAAVGSLFRRRYREVRAVDGISFDIAPGEVVGFLGPNGAGKTTTLKMLAGLLQPTDGEARVLGEVPGRRRSGYLRRMALVMGNRNQLHWDLPAADSFELNRAIYQIPWPQFRSTTAELVELLDLGDLVTKPVRNLSLGERMKVELAAALLHRPEVLFLDEPTLGLDLTMQRRIRAFVADYNRRYSASVLLTSHYMADVEALCKRVIVIDHGRILFDGHLGALGTELAAYKELAVTIEGDTEGDTAGGTVGGTVGGIDLAAYGEVRGREGGRVTLRVPKAQAPMVTARLLAEHTVLDLTVEDPPIEDVIELLFSRGVAP